LCEYLHLGALAGVRTTNETSEKQNSILVFRVNAVVLPL